VLTPVTNLDVAKCWLVPGNGVDTISCTQLPLPATPLGAPVLSVEADGTNHHPIQFLDSAGAIAMLSVESDDYPIAMHLKVSLSGATGVIGIENVETLNTSFEITGADAPTADAPEVVTLPFSLWPIEILPAIDSLQAILDPYTLQLQPFSRDSSGADSIAEMNENLNTDDQPTKYWLAVPPGTAMLSGSATASKAGASFTDPVMTNVYRFSVTGAGYYVAAFDGIHPASQDETANAFKH
jgi:hypothetical protein